MRGMDGHTSDKIAGGYGNMTKLLARNRALLACALGIALAAGCSTLRPTDPAKTKPPRLAHVLTADFGLAMISDIAFTPDGKYLLVSQLGGIARFDGHTFAAIDYRAVVHEGNFRGFPGRIAVSPDSRRVAYARIVQGKGNLPRMGEDVFIRDIETWEETQHLEMPGAVRAVPPPLKLGDRGSIYDMAYSPDGRHLAAGSDNAMVGVWEVESGKLVQGYGEHKDLMYRLGWLDDETIVSGQYPAHIWNIREPSKGSLLEGFNFFAVSPDGAWLCGEKPPVGVQILNRDSGRITSWRGLGYPTGAAFAPNGRSLAFACELSVYVVGVPEGRKLAQLVWLYIDGRGYHAGGHLQTIQHLGFSPDGRFLASASGEGKVLIWDVADLTR
ncbi:MAG: hypothetical protein HYZ53_27780 [Planctomycetes bacterium]|nr:hypothetical protein [Planctomycetota bacterium]